MPLFYYDQPAPEIQLAIWKIEEQEDFFMQLVPLSAAIQHPHKRKQHLAGRFLLRFLAPDFPLSEIAIADSRKPYLPDDKYHFSISHCGDYAAAIISKSKRVGIDIEMFDKKVLRIEHKFLNEGERDFLRTEEHRSLELITTLWCAKEAIFKWFSFGQVNFKENILLSAFNLKNAGAFNAAFSNKKLHADLKVHYRLFENISMTWVSGGEKNIPQFAGYR